MKCPVCRCDVGPENACPRCNSFYHADCKEYVGRCSIYGCESSRRLPGAGFLDVVLGIVLAAGLMGYIYFSLEYTINRGPYSRISSELELEW